ncbi:hypothetical protein OUZ56_033172 [Daphnia magna]|uniref:Uncharacterized protein n=1 Tax=Daphnia magna TaxID=35525 RepID=A0ABR0BAE6_9CRUS|nr:hypothetical protein OUZ56_033172 [Daphnia magna]
MTSSARRSIACAASAPATCTRNALDEEATERPRGAPSVPRVRDDSPGAAAQRARVRPTEAACRRQNGREARSRASSRGARGRRGAVAERPWVLPHGTAHRACSVPPHSPQSTKEMAMRASLRRHRVNAPPGDRGPRLRRHVHNHRRTLANRIKPRVHSRCRRGIDAVKRRLNNATRVSVVAPC